MHSTSIKIIWSFCRLTDRNLKIKIAKKYRFYRIREGIAEIR